MANHFHLLATELLEKLLAYLNFDDFISLRSTQRSLLKRLSSETLCKAIIDRESSHSNEAKLAQQGRISYAEAVHRNAVRKEAFRSARPFSVAVLAFGNHYVYREGVLCYCRGEVVRLFKVQENQTETVIDVRRLLQGASLGQLPGVTNRTIHEAKALLNEPFAIEILQYHAGVVSFLVVSESKSSLITINTTATSTKDAHRLLAMEFGLYPGSILRGPASRPGMKVMVTPKMMYYVCAHRNPYTSEYGWAMYFKPFGRSESDELPHLRDLFRTWPGQSVAFKIHDGDMFPIDDLESCSNNSAPAKLEFVRIWRPHPVAKPEINTLWSDLTLQEDEKTGELMISEYRSLPVGERQSMHINARYDLQPLCFPPSFDPDLEEQDLPHKLIVGLSAGELATRYFKTFSQADRPPGPAPHETTYPNSFDTRYRTYNLSCNASLTVGFAKIVSGDPEHNQVNSKIRFSVSAQKRHGDGRNDRNTTAGAINSSDSDRNRVKSSRIFIWPPANAPRALLDLLDPFPDRECALRAQSDEGSLVYMIGPKNTNWVPQHRESGLQVGDSVFLKRDIEAIQNAQTLSLADEASLKRDSNQSDSVSLDSRNDAGQSNVQDTTMQNAKESGDDHIECSHPSKEILHGTHDRSKYEDHAIILINFDPSIKLPGLERIRLRPSAGVVDDSGADKFVAHITEQLADQSLGSAQKKAKGVGGTLGASSTDDRGDQTSWFREEPAMWRNVRRGFEIEY
ncbi:hypothetical protein ACLMJK_009666 [Lecanora helva]